MGQTLNLLLHFGGVGMQAAGRLLSRELWRWYVMLFIANELDLVYTYFGLSNGRFHEANPFLAPHLYSWWPIILKIVPLAGLALGIYVALRGNSRYQRRVLSLIRVATAIYVVILVMHLVNLVANLARG